MCVCAGVSCNVQQSGDNVHVPVEQAGAHAVGPGGLPLPQPPGALAEGPARQAGLLLLLAQKRSPALLLACGLLLSTGNIMLWSGVYLGELLLQLLCSGNSKRPASKTA